MAHLNGFVRAMQVDGYAGYRALAMKATVGGRGAIRTIRWPANTAYDCAIGCIGHDHRASA